MVEFEAKSQHLIFSSIWLSVSKGCLADQNILLAAGVPGPVNNKGFCHDEEFDERGTLAGEWSSVSMKAAQHTEQHNAP